MSDAWTRIRAVSHCQTRLKPSSIKATNRTAQNKSGKKIRWGSVKVHEYEAEAEHDDICAEVLETRLDGEDRGGKVEEVGSKVKGKGVADEVARELWKLADTHAWGA